jgi:hypothetical protein
MVSPRKHSHFRNAHKTRSLPETGVASRKRTAIADCASRWWPARSWVAVRSVAVAEGRAYLAGARPQVQLVDGVSLVNLRCLQSGTRSSARVRPHFINTRRTMHQWVQRTPA